MLNATNRPALSRVILTQRTMTFILVMGRCHVDIQIATPRVGPLLPHHALPAVVGDMMEAMIIATRLLRSDDGGP